MPTIGGYGIPAIPTQPLNYLPTEFTEHTETTGGEEKSVYICEIRGRTLRSLTICVHLCASVGGSSTPEASVYSVNSVGGYSPPEASVYICEIRGRLFSARSFCVFCEIRGRISSARSFCVFCAICGRTCANKLGMGSVEGIWRAAWVWQGCHTLLHLWASVQSVGEYPPPEASVYSVKSVGGLA